MSLDNSCVICPLYALAGLICATVLRLRPPRTAAPLTTWISAILFWPAIAFFLFLTWLEETEL